MKLSGGYKITNNSFKDKSIQPITQREIACLKYKNSKNVTVVLPAYNEEASIGSIILLTRLYANNIVVVDSGSKDRTMELARKAGAEVVINKIGTEKNVSLEPGLKIAAENGADIIVTMDSEGRHDPADIPLLVAPILKGEADLVSGSRYLNEFSKGNHIYRRIGHRILDKFISIDSNLKITDPESSFRAFSMTKKEIFSSGIYSVLLDNDILVNAENSGIRITEVEIGKIYQSDNLSRDPVKRISESMQNLLQDIEENKPLYFYSVPGFGLATCGLYMGFKFLEGFLLGIANVELWSSFLMIFLAFSGIYLTIRGIVMHSPVEPKIQLETS